MKLWRLVLFLLLVTSCTTQTVPLPPPEVRVSAEQQACIELWQQAVSQVLWPFVVVVSLMIVALMLPFWPRRKMVDMIVTENAEGDIIQIRYARNAMKWRTPHKTPIKEGKA